MDRDKITLREAIRRARGFRLEGQQPEVPEWRQQLNDYIRAAPKKSVSELPLDHPVFRNEDRPR